MIKALAKTILVSAMLLASPSSGQERRPFEMVKVADGVYAFIDHDGTREFVFGNSIVVIGDEGALVYDTNQLPSLARRVLAEVRRLTDKPIRYVVNSHWHWDHTMGNQVYREAFPQVEIIAHSETRREGDVETPRMLAGVANHTDFLKRLRDYQNAGKKGDGRPLTVHEVKRLEQLIKDVETYYHEFKSARYLSPTMTFERKLTLSLGQREVQLLSLGKGNTAGDVVAYLPKEKALLTGDLLVHPIPYSFGSFPPEWAQTLRKLSELDVAIIVPGHGPIQRNKEYLTLITGLLDSVVGQASESVKRGLSLEETRAAINLDSYRSRLAGDDPERNYAFEHYFFTPATERIYQQARRESVISQPETRTNATRRALDLYFIDVEGGAATLIVTPAGESVLIDAGWDGFDGRDAKRIQRAIGQAGITTIDHMVTTHYHRDHYGGVPELARLAAIRRFYDHGKMTSLPDDTEFPERFAAYQAATKGQTTTLKPGDSIPLKSGEGEPPIQLLCVAARATVITGDAESANPACTSAEPNEDTSDNSRSVALLLKFGDFDFLNLADLSWNVSKRLFCPSNRIGQVDLYQVTHHGGNISNDPALLRSLSPTVAVMINGPRKGGHPDTIKWLRETPSLRALYQLHRNVQTTSEQNAPSEFIANLDEQPDAANMITVSVDSTTRAFTVTNGRTKESRSYQFK